MHNKIYTRALKLVYMCSELLYVSANCVAIIRDIKYKGWVHQLYGEIIKL